MPPVRTQPSTSGQTLSGDKNHVKRPPNPWILFRSENIKLIPPPPPGQPPLTQAALSRKLAEMWRDLSVDNRETYVARSKAVKDQHLRDNPGYRFQPMKKEEKMRLKAEREAQKMSQRRRTRENASTTRKKDRRDPPLPLLTTAPLYDATRPFPTTVYASSSVSKDPIVVPPVVKPPIAPSGPEPTAPAVRAPSTSHGQVTTSPSQHPTPSASPSAATPSTLRLSPYPPSPATISIPQVVAPQPTMPQYSPSASTSSWHQSSPPQYAQPQQQAEYGISPLTLDADGLSLDYSENGFAAQHLTIPLSQQSVQNPTEWNPNGSYTASIEPRPTDDPLLFIFGTGDGLSNEDLFNDPRGIQVDTSSLMDPNSFGFFNSYASTSSESFDGSMAGTVPQGDLRGFTELFDSLIQEDPSNFAGPSQSDAPLADASETSTMRPADVDEMIATLLASLEQGGSADANEAGSTFFSPETQPQQPQQPPSVNEYTVPDQPAYVPPGSPAYVPPAGATYSSTRRVGAYWKHRRASDESDVAMS